MTEKLYENNSLLHECESIVTDCIDKDDKYFIELDKTVFFPESGGQLSDKGYLNDVYVSHVSINDGKIFHICSKPIKVGSKVKAVIDWNVRLDRMQQHLGEHILSYVCWKLYNANNIGFHMSEDLVTIDLDKMLTSIELEMAESMANSIIWDNRAIRITYLSCEDASQMEMRKFNSKLQGVLRIVSIDGADVCTCCGTHPPFTGMVGCLKIVGSEKHKSGMRIEFLCGNRAIRDYHNKNKELLNAARMLSVKPLEVQSKIERMQQEILSAGEKIKYYQNKILYNKLQDIIEKPYITPHGEKYVILDVENSKSIKLLAAQAEKFKNLHIIVVCVQPKQISYAAIAAADTEGACRYIIKVLNDSFNGHGGGKDNLAQGGADYCENWKEKIEKIKEKLDY